MSNERICIEDNTISAIMKLAEGNPGALNVCMNIIESGPEIDPIGGLGPLLSMDTLGIYGSRIWMLYKDVCGEDLPKTLAILRAWQLGFLEKGALLHAIDNCGEGIDIEKMVAAVCERLPEFKMVI